MVKCQSRRKEYLDIAKGIGIILVVLGHCPSVYNPLKQWIYSFHMPLFFFVGGMVWNKSSHEKMGFFSHDFIIRKIKRLLIPCFIWGLLYMFIDAIVSQSFSIKRIAYLLYGSQAGFRHAGSLTSLWFLPCMFLSVCAFEIIQQSFAKVKHSTPKLFFASIILAIMGLFLPRSANGYPWSADVAFLTVAFMIWSHLLVNHFENTVLKKTAFAFLILFMFAISLTYILNLSIVPINNVDLAGRYLGNQALYVLNATTGSAFIILLSILLCGSHSLSKYISALGRKTIPILILHKPIVKLFDHLWNKLGFPRILSVVVSVIISISCSLLVYHFIRRFLPIAFGENNYENVITEDIK